MTLKTIKRIVFLMPQAVRSAPFMVTTFPHLIVHGGISVDTPFEYRSPQEGQARRFFFRTVIQMDADIINFLPRPDSFPDDPGWTQLYEEKYKAHRARVEALFAKLDGLPSLAWLVSGGLSLASVTVAARTFIGEMETLLFRFSFLSLSVFLTYVFRKYLLRSIFKGAILFGGYWMKKRGWRAQA